MAIRLSKINDGKILEIHVSGKLLHRDYEQFVPEFERLQKQYGKLSVLFEMEDFHGWKTRAAWDDFKFGMKHRNDIDRIALVGDSKWERKMASMCRPFTHAEVRYFDLSHRDDARAWVEAA